MRSLGAPRRFLQLQRRGPRGQRLWSVSGYQVTVRSHVQAHVRLMHRSGRIYRAAFDEELVEVAAGLLDCRQAVHGSAGCSFRSACLLAIFPRVFGVDILEGA